MTEMARCANKPARNGPDADGILNALPDPILVVDAQDNLISMNQAGEQFFGSSETALAGTNLQDLIPQDSPALSLIRKARNSGSTMTVHGVQLSTPRIGSHTLSVDAAPLVDRPGAMAVTLKALTIAGKIDDALTQRGAARSVTALSSMLAHEVKNPLSGIRGAAQLLESMIAAEDRQLTRLITEETDRIVKLLDRMEVFSDQPSLERHAVNIHEVLDRAIEVARNGFAVGKKITAVYDPSLPPVYGDRDQLVQIFLNLVKNAAEAVDTESGEITVTTAFRQGVRLAVPGREARVHLPLIVSIKDNGPGIPDDIRQHLFDPFVSTKNGGSGLGLALVAKLVGDHGGVIDVASRPRRTVFSVMLPMVKEDEG